MAAIHDQLEAEGVQYFSDGAYLTRGRIGDGRLYVTGKRVVFLRQNVLFSQLGALGGLLSAKLTPKKVGFEIPVSAVTGVTRGTFLRNKNVLEVTYEGAEKPARFAIKSYDTAVVALQRSGAPVG